MNETLINELQNASSQKERSNIYGQLYSNNSGLIAIVCGRWSRWKNVEFDDLFQEAYFFLVKAADDYATANPDKRLETVFTTYLSNSLHWCFIRYFHIKHKYVDNERYCIRLDESIDKSDSDGATLAEFIADESQDVEKEAVDRLYSEECGRILADITKDYAPEIKAVLHRRLVMGQTFPKISTVLGKSAERVRQIYRNGINKLRQSDIKTRLASALSDEDESIAFRTSGYKFWKEHGMSSVEFVAIRRESNDREKRRAALYGNYLLS